MKIINNALINLALLPAGLYRRMGADTRLVKTILVTKLKVDERTPSSLQQMQRRKKEKPASMATLSTVFISALMGLLYLFAFSFGQNLVTQLTLYFSMFLLLLASMLIADFTSVLLDVRDNIIILTRPVNDATFITARLLHIFIHLTKVVVPMTLPGVIYIGYNFPWAYIAWFLFIILLLTLFAIFFINAVYLVAMRLVSPQRFQTFVSYLQVALAVIMYASYQVVPRMMGDLSNFEYEVGIHAYALLIPSFWFASGFALLVQKLGAYEIVGAVFCFTLPLLGIWLVVRFLAGSFVRNLSLTGASGGTTETPAKGVSATKGKLAEWLSRTFIPKGPQRAGFLFAWKMSGRSRDFRMKVLPAIGYLFVYVFLILFKPLSGGKAHQNFDGEGPEKFLVLSVLYFGVFALITAIGHMKHSEKWKAGWIFFSAPVQHPGPIISGAFKALVFKFYLPIALPFALATILFIGPSMIPNVLLALANQILLSALMVRIVSRNLPFALPQQGGEKGGALLRSLMVLSIAAVVSVFHYFIFTILPAVILCTLLSFVAVWLVLNSIKEISWSAIRQADT